MCSVTNTIIMTCIIMQHDAPVIRPCFGNPSRYATCTHNIMHAVVMGYALIGVGPPHIYACSFIILICIYLYIFNTLPYNELRSYAAVLRRRGLSTREPPHHARYVTVHFMFGLLSAA